MGKIILVSIIIWAAFSFLSVTWEVKNYKWLTYQIPSVKAFSNDSWYINSTDFDFDTDTYSVCTWICIDNYSSDTGSSWGWSSYSWK